MPAALIIPPLDADTRAEVERRYNLTADADTRLPYLCWLFSSSVQQYSIYCCTDELNSQHRSSRCVCRPSCR